MGKFFIVMFSLLFLGYVNAALDSAGSSVQIGVPQNNTSVEPSQGGSGASEALSPSLEEEVPDDEKPEEAIQENILKFSQQELEAETEQPGEDIAKKKISKNLIFGLGIIILLSLVIWLIIEHHKKIKVETIKMPAG